MPSRRKTEHVRVVRFDIKIFINDMNRSLRRTLQLRAGIPTKSKDSLIETMASGDTLIERATPVSMEQYDILLALEYAEKTDARAVAEYLEDDYASEFLNGAMYWTHNRHILCIQGKTEGMNVIKALEDLQESSPNLADLGIVIFAKQKN